MKRFKIVMVAFLIIVSGKIFAQGPFPPAAGQDGSTAIHLSSDQFVCWASGIQLTRGYTDISNPTNLVFFGYPSLGLGIAEGGSMEVVSLGDAGEVILTFDRPIINGPGFDFAVFENSFDDSFLELAFVEVSSDGSRFVRFPAVSLTSETEQVGSFGTVDPTYIHNLAGKYRQGYGTPFDLDDIIDSTRIDLNNIRFVKLVDVIGCVNEPYATYDSQGHIVNDPWPTDFYSGGFDLDAVGVINAGTPYQLTNFNDLSLEDNSYWDGSDLSGSFRSGIMQFVNSYNTDYSTFLGFAYSNTTDAETPDYTNQFSAITGGGMDAGGNGGTNYGVAYISLDWMSGTNAPIPVETDFIDGETHVVNGLFVANSTYSFLTMRDGNFMCKKFGGDSGNDPDWFKLVAYGIDEFGNSTDSLEFYLADFRFDDNSKDYLVDNWRWFDLRSLGKVSGLRFFVLSSDVGDYGINTPTYFCMDNLYIDIESGQGIDVNTNDLLVNVYPNPTSGRFFVSADDCDVLQVYNAQGQLVSVTTNLSSQTVVDISQQPSGVYFVRLIQGNRSFNKKIVKQ